jgi:hypothetical protein
LRARIISELPLRVWIRIQGGFTLNLMYQMMKAGLAFGGRGQAVKTLTKKRSLFHH